MVLVLRRLTLPLLFLFLFLIVFQSCTNHKLSSELKLVNTYEIQTKNSIEPSGLTEWNGEFYTVSDKHNAIFKLVFRQNQIDLLPIIQIESFDGKKLDFEGITHDDENFYLISERLFKILKVSKDGVNQTWLPTEDLLKTSGLDAGLFQVNNANFEGICLLKDNGFLLAAEREPRGFIEFNSNADIQAYQVNEPRFKYEKDISPDFTGLSCDDGIYVLDRNAYMVAELKKVNGQFIESKGYSFKHVVMQPQYQYQDMKYGHAEGLVVKGNKVYIILDNNKNPRKSNPENNNSLFIELEK